jgi:CubicO group peptidase (beta-lactamase class C family)
MNMPVILFLLFWMLGLPLLAQHQDANLLKHRLDSIATQYKISSIGYALVYDDSITLADAVGVQTREGKEAVGPNTVYRIGSVTKSFVALGVMKLADEGKVNLNTPLRQLLPELPIDNPWEATHPVLLKHLLEHTAGFSDLHIADYNHDDAGAFPSLEEVVGTSPEYWVCRWAPGTRHAYSNPGYTLLGLIIEKITSRSYVDYLEEVLLKPLGMNQSDLLGKDLSRLASSYLASGEPDFPGIIFDHPAGYMHTTPSDMARYARFLLNGAQFPDGSYFLKNQSFRSMQVPESITGANGSMIGYGKGLYSLVYKTDLGFGHDGGIDSYISSLAIYPARSFAYYFTITGINSEAYDAVGKILMNWLDQEKTEAPPKENQVTASLDQAFLGWYRSEVYRQPIERFTNAIMNFGKLYYEGDTLVFKPLFDKAVVLQPLGNNYFSTNKALQPNVFIGSEGEDKVLSAGNGPLAGYMVHSSFLRAAWWLMLLGAGLGVFLLSYLISLVNLLLALAGSYKSNIKPMVWQVLSVFLLIPLFYGLSAGTDLSKISVPNVYTLSLVLATGGFGLMWLIGLLSFRHGKTHQHFWKSIPLRAGYLAWLAIIIVMAAFDFMPLMIWKM